MILKTSRQDIVFTNKGQYLQYVPIFKFWYTARGKRRYLGEYHTIQEMLRANDMDKKVTLPMFDSNEQNIPKRAEYFTYEYVKPK